MSDPTERVVQRLLTDDCRPFALLRRRTPAVITTPSRC